MPRTSKFGRISKFAGITQVRNEIPDSETTTAMAPVTAIEQIAEPAAEEPIHISSTCIGDIDTINNDTGTGILELEIDSGDDEHQDINDNMDDNVELPLDLVNFVEPVVTGNRIVSLSKLVDHVKMISQHSGTCGAVQFIGETRMGLASYLKFQCKKCSKVFQLVTSDKVTYNGSSRFSVNVGATLGQVATGGGAAHLEEQLSALDIPSIHHTTFIDIERQLGQMLDDEVTAEIVEAGKEEKRVAEENGDYHNGIPAISVVVDGGWSKRSHKHSYNANSGVGVIFGAATKRLLYIGVRNKYCSTCAIAARKGVAAAKHQCFRNWAGSSCAMEADIILEGFKQSIPMHGLQYMNLIGDGDSSVYNTIVTSVSYGRDVKKVECANHAVKCYRTRLEAVVKDNTGYGGRGGLTKQIIKRISAGARCAIKYHSTTGDVAALRYDLRNGPRHCFGDHTRCKSSFCRHRSSTSAVQSPTEVDTAVATLSDVFNTSDSSCPLDKLPQGLLVAVEAAGDRLVNKASQLIQDETTNLSECYMSVRTKMDGGKIFNMIQSGSFQHRCMAAALRMQLGPEWMGTIWERKFTDPLHQLLELGQSRKRKHQLDLARKTSQKYKKMRMMKRLSTQAVADASYGTHPAVPEIDEAELGRLGKEFVERLSVSDDQVREIAQRTWKQADDPSGEWQSQRKGRITSSHFGEVCKRKRPFAPLTIRLLYGKTRATAAMRYGSANESIARAQYLEHLQASSPTATVTQTGLHIYRSKPWLASSPVFNPSNTDPHGLLEIKCPYSAKEVPLTELCTAKSSFLKCDKTTKEITLKRSHNYFYQIQGQMATTGYPWCDFYVWTPRSTDFFLQHIRAEPQFWENMVAKMTHFFRKSMLPELVSSRHVSGQELRELSSDTEPPSSS